MLIVWESGHERRLTNSSFRLSLTCHDDGTGSLALTGSVIHADVSADNVSGSSKEILQVLPADVETHL